jgi:hypothetical protein
LMRALCGRAVPFARELTRAAAIPALLGVYVMLSLRTIRAACIVGDHLRLAEDQIGARDTAWLDAVWSGVVARLVGLLTLPHNATRFTVGLVTSVRIEFGPLCGYCEIFDDSDRCLNARNTKGFVAGVASSGDRGMTAGRSSCPIWWFP